MGLPPLISAPDNNHPLKQACSVSDFSHLLKLNNTVEQSKEETKQPIRMQTNIRGEITSFKT